MLKSDSNTNPHVLDWMFPTGRIEPEVMNTVPPVQAKWIFTFRRDDIQARLTLVRAADSAYEMLGDPDLSAFLMDAADYLADRAAFQGCR